MPSVSVIIPTTCEAHRWPLLLRAIRSVQEHGKARVEVIAVVNGGRFDRGCYDELAALPGVRVLYREEGSAPLAQYAGRLAVATDFFAFLDDDDEYLPGAVDARVQALLDDPSLDFVATNGYRHSQGQDQLAVRDGDAVRRDPLSSLGAENWMASCAGLFRSATVDPGFFEKPAAYLEWTYLAYKLASTRRMRFLDLPTFRIYDSPGSLSKSAAYREAELGVIERVLALSLPAHVRRGVERKRGRILHDCAERHRESGQIGLAWRCHLRSLRAPGGGNYLLYSRKLLIPGSW